MAGTSKFPDRGGAVTVSATGALDGDGTVADPLAVLVDNVTVQINGSNQLVSVGTGDVSGPASAVANMPALFSGTGGKTIQSALADPNADRALFWDDSAGSTALLTMGNSVAITDTTLDTIQDIRTTAGPTFASVSVGTGPFASSGDLRFGAAVVMSTVDGGFTFISEDEESPFVYKTDLNNYGFQHWSSDGAVKLSTYLIAQSAQIGTITNHDLVFFVNDGSPAWKIDNGTGDLEAGVGSGGNIRGLTAIFSGGNTLDINAGAQVAINSALLTIPNGGRFTSSTADAETAGLSVYDVNGTAYRDFLVWTNGNAPAVAMTIPTTGTLDITATSVQSAYKSSDGSSGVTAGPFTTITSITVKNGIVTALSGA